MSRRGGKGRGFGSGFLDFLRRNGLVSRYLGMTGRSDIGRPPIARRSLALKAGHACPSRHGPRQRGLGIVGEGVSEVGLGRSLVRICLFRWN